MRKISFIGLVLAATALSPATQAQTLAAGDRTFLQDQAQGTAYELAIAKLAEQKAVHPDMKAYAQTIVSDHEQLNAQLQQLATSKGVDLPATMTGKQQANLKRLQGLSGRAFDQAYRKETVRINAEDAKQDQAELGKTADPSVNTFVEALQKSDAKHQELGKALK